MRLRHDNVTVPRSGDIVKSGKRAKPTLDVLGRNLHLRVIGAIVDTNEDTASVIYNQPLEADPEDLLAEDDPRLAVHQGSVHGDAILLLAAVDSPLALVRQYPDEVAPFLFQIPGQAVRFAPRQINPVAEELFAADHLVATRTFPCHVTPPVTLQSVYHCRQDYRC